MFGMINVWVTIYLQFPLFFFFSPTDLFSTQSHKLGNRTTPPPLLSITYLSLKRYILYGHATPVYKSACFKYISFIPLFIRVKRRKPDYAGLSFNLWLSTTPCIYLVTRSLLQNAKGETMMRNKGEKIIGRLFVTFSMQRCSFLLIFASFISYGSKREERIASVFALHRVSQICPVLLMSTVMCENQ